jgi:hypothetical protein
MKDDVLRDQAIQGLEHSKVAIREEFETLRSVKRAQPGTLVLVSVNPIQSEAHHYLTEATRFVERWPDDSRGPSYVSDARNLLFEIANLNT